MLVSQRFQLVCVVCESIARDFQSSARIGQRLVSVVDATPYDDIEIPEIQGQEGDQVEAGYRCGRGLLTPYWPA